jgi:hypothetical protein
MAYHHLALATRDMKGIEHFYREVMGFDLKKVEIGPAPQGGWAKHFFYEIEPDRFIAFMAASRRAENQWHDDHNPKSESQNGKQSHDAHARSMEPEQVPSALLSTVNVILCVSASAPSTLRFCVTVSLQPRARITHLLHISNMCRYSRRLSNLALYRSSVDCRDAHPYSGG